MVDDQAESPSPRFPAVAGAMVAATVALSAQQVTFEPPRTPWGDPDLQGIYTSSTHTPLERPAEFKGKQFFTEEEAAEYVQTRQKELLEQPRDSIHYDDAVWQNEKTPRGLSSLRTSLVVDPPDGGSHR